MKSNILTYVTYKFLPVFIGVVDLLGTSLTGFGDIQETITSLLMPAACFGIFLVMSQYFYRAAVTKSEIRFTSKINFRWDEVEKIRRFYRLYYLRTKADEVYFFPAQATSMNPFEWIADTEMDQVIEMVKKKYLIG